jgi:hypothetical protein
VYEDGRVIWEKLGDASQGGPPVGAATGLVEQRLTPAGVELVRAAVLAVVPFDEDTRLVSASALYGGMVEVRSGDRLVGLSWGGFGPERRPETTATPEQIDALRALDARLEHLESWLPASAWADAEVRAYVPSRYSLCLETVRDADLDRVMASLPEPAVETLRAWDLSYRETEHPDALAPWDLWCSDVTSEQARELARVLDDAGVRSNEGDVFGLTYTIPPSGAEALRVSIFFVADLPHEP